MDSKVLSIEFYGWAAELMLAATSVTIDSEAVRRLGRRKRRREGVAQLDWSPVEVRQVAS